MRIAPAAAVVIVVAFAVGCTGAGTADDDAPMQVPPVITGMTPTSGPYGTTITITGAGFYGATIAFDGAATSTEDSSWTTYTTQVTARVPFPATGAVSIRNDAGNAAVGTFAAQSMWAPGTSYDLPALIESRALGSGAVAALAAISMNLELAVFGGPNAGNYTLPYLYDDDDGGSLHAEIVADDTGAAEVLSTMGTTREFVVVTTAGGQVMTTPTAITSATLVAASRDASGVYAWLVTDAGLERVRPPSWAVDRGPIAIPTDGPELAAAVGADGTLAWAESAQSYCAGGSIGVENCYSAYVARLPPDATAFLAAEDAAAPVAYDAIGEMSLLVSPDGSRIVVVGDATSNGNPTSFARARAAAGTWDQTACDPQTCAFTTGELIQLAYGDANGDVGPVLATEPDSGGAIQELGLWPAMPQALVADPANPDAMPQMLLYAGLTYAPVMAPGGQL